jgi:hypothetical protein
MSVLLTERWEGCCHREEPLDGGQRQPAAGDGEDAAPQVGGGGRHDALEARRDPHDAHAPQPLVEVDPDQRERQPEQPMGGVNDLHHVRRQHRCAFHRGIVRGWT